MPGDSRAHVLWTSAEEEDPSAVVEKVGSHVVPPTLASSSY
jgi:hypothetical protein